MTRASRPRTVIVGTGRLARAIAPLLVARGYPVLAVAGRRAAAARAVVRSIGAGRASTRPDRMARDAELVLLAVPDREIAPLAQRLAAAGAASRGQTFLHHAGALGVDVLEPLRRAGAAVGVLHPLQSLGVPGLAREVLAGSAARIEGSGRGLRVARRLARDLRLVPVWLGPAAGREQRVAYHAAAAMASNDVVALLGTALDLLARAGIDRARGLSMLVPLARGTLLQAEHGGLGAAITGPASRGDAETVGEHLLALGEISADAAAVHRLLSRQLLDLARREGLSIAPADRRRVLRLLGARGGRGQDPAV